jgi:pheromone a factor receptor
MSMALVQMFWGIAITALDMSFTMKNGLRPWTGWDDVHVGFSRIALFPTLVIPAKVLTFTYLLWWAVPISSVIFFGFFSFGQDAMKEYRTCIQWVGRNVFRLPDPPAKVNSMASLPS